MKLKIVLLAQPTDNEKIEIEEDTTLYVRCIAVESNHYFTQWILEEKHLDFATCYFDNLKLKKVTQINQLN